MQCHCHFLPVIKTSKGIKNAKYLEAISTIIEAQPMTYETAIERDRLLNTIRDVIQNVSTARSLRGFQSDEDDAVNEVSTAPEETTDICDYCNNSNNNEQKANATKCPGRTTH